MKKTTLVAFILLIIIGCNQKNNELNSVQNEKEKTKIKDEFIKEIEQKDDLILLYYEEVKKLNPSTNLPDPTKKG